MNHSGQKEADFVNTSTTMEDTKGVRDLQVILRPLPKIPVRESGYWSQRVSGVSGIYEEIPNGDGGPRRTSRGSIASGIYEEMNPPKTNSSKFDTVSSKTKPPLPQTVRKSMNTNEIDFPPIRRSNSSTEAELSKMKYLTVFGSIYGRLKRSASVSEDKVSQLADFEEIPKVTVVSDQIQPNFNISNNMSTMNLVGSNSNSTKPSVNAIVEDLSGYCVMAPIKKDRKKLSNSNMEHEIDTKVSYEEQIYEKMNLNKNTSSTENVTSQDTHIYQNRRASKLKHINTTN